MAATMVLVNSPTENSDSARKRRASKLVVAGGYVIGVMQSHESPLALAADVGMYRAQRTSIKC